MSEVRMAFTDAVYKDRHGPSLFLFLPVIALVVSALVPADPKWSHEGCELYHDTYDFSLLFCDGMPESKHSICDYYKHVNDLTLCTQLSRLRNACPSDTTKALKHYCRL